MKTTKLLTSAVAIAFGVFMFFYGGYDDSPGGQLLGLVLAIVGIVGIWRTLHKKKEQGTR